MLVAAALSVSRSRAVPVGEPLLNDKGDLELGWMWSEIALLSVMICCMCVGGALAGCLCFKVARISFKRGSLHIGFNRDELPMFQVPGRATKRTVTTMAHTHYTWHNSTPRHVPWNNFAGTVEVIGHHA